MSTRTLIAGAALVLAAACQPARTTNACGPQPLDPSTPVARLSTGTVTAGELEQLVKGDLRKLETDYQQQVYDVRRRALESLIIKRVVEAKAKAENLSADDFAQREVLKRIAEPTD
ncbi:MAG TPA: thioredoxin, partial [Anaeromyxobacteraceae bacterium]|nr:thioredoxin [Anaeromyxobacteraceae bacterium]